jgi:hypothetical protein
MRGGDDGEVDRLVEEWFDPETQAALTALVARLREKKSSADKEKTP